MDVNTIIGWLSNIDFGTIPTENVVLVSALLSGYVAYQTRKNSLETNRERERYLNFRLQDGTQFSDTWGITIGNIFVHENSGILYRLKKFFTGTMTGKSTVVVMYKHGSIPGTFWSEERVQDLVSGYDIEVRHIKTMEHLDPTVAKFSIHSVDDGDISGFLTTSFNSINISRKSLLRDVVGHRRKS